MDSEKKYPFDYSDEEILKRIEELSGRDNNYDPGSPTRMLKIILGLTEIQRRSSKRFAKWSIILSIMVIVFSATAVFYAYNTNKINNQWQEKQIQILKEIKEELKEQ